MRRLARRRSYAGECVCGGDGACRGPDGVLRFHAASAYIFAPLGCGAGVLGGGVGLLLWLWVGRGRGRSGWMLGKFEMGVWGGYLGWDGVDLFDFWR